ncbi:Tetratricopeptide repeat-containing protein [Catalinimonas alkaloidigena]|uniref:Tetratricopeptide repeat-containing protein n=1 Tax=Catalinimonas alkaloidigena TaxID=1075417 RepID=A0A1G8Y5X6_9BACT|nr:DUF5107 domain-containing protein [Catalinimonas alkaloidigena]SDJ98206.1 Tetratricopeptide repeat-containing protein [Catalinimonas alkaloidigena]
MKNDSLSAVHIWEEPVVIPTYPVGAPDRNPMFLEKRVYQGSSGVVYPHPVIDKVADAKEDRTYTALFLENRYLKIMILPELGGRVQMAYDKLHDYHFVYYNQVIKPALVGLAGPWISGGIEFNWPQHHRPSTFSPVDYRLEAHADGSATVWVSEVEIMFHTKGMAGFTLHPDRAYLEITGKLYNRTALPQTFLWWANPAVHVDEHYQSVFPPDVTAVYDHGKRDVSSFPIATGTYYKVDYAPGTDISRYKNIPVPTSYMAVDSKFDFMGGYHHQKQVGLLYVADHHVSPGKKQWTWGHGDFGQAWDRHLTDEDGPYFELMTGMYTDNQPDFGWIMPNEERVFTQYFMPYQGIGYVKNATTEAAVNLEVADGKATVGVYVMAPQPALRVVLEGPDETYLDAAVALTPEAAYTHTVALPAGTDATLLTLRVLVDERELVRYTPVPRPEGEPLPDPAKAIPAPEQVPTNEELYLAGLHLEQYRHATYSPVAYYEEALRRDPGDTRNNQALGAWYLRRGQFTKAEGYLRTALRRQQKHNPNPYDGEALYLLGLTLSYQERWDEAFDAFYKACWNAAWQDTAYLQLARIASRRERWHEALTLVEQSLHRNAHGYEARHLKAVVLRKLGRTDAALAYLQETLQEDGFEFGSRYEQTLLQTGAAAEEAQTQLTHLMRGNPSTYLAVALDYYQAGLYAEGMDLLATLAPHTDQPMVFYFLAFGAQQREQPEAARHWAERGFACSPDRVFPNRLEDIGVLQTVMTLLPHDYKAPYYLGNLWYDKRQYDEAIACWEASVAHYDRFATTHRNLGLAYFNKRQQPERALASYERAFALQPDDARVFFELDQLRKRLGWSVERRYAAMQAHPALVQERDDLYVEHVTLANLLGKWDEGADLLASRRFHPWEGGEGKVSRQYVYNQLGRARRALDAHRYAEAQALLQAALTYPPHLGEGKLFGAQENDLYYELGNALEGLGDGAQARTCWQQAAVGLSEPTQAIFYNDQQPDQIFYQGLALRKLGQEETARQRFQRLIDYGNAHLHDVVKIDFFAVSLPDLMIFDDDLTQRNQAHCHYLMGLGYLGLQDSDAARRHLERVMALDAAHQGAWMHRAMLVDVEAASVPQTERRNG